MHLHRTEDGKAGAQQARRAQRAGRTAVRWALVAAWACLIVFMSSNTGSNLSGDLGFFSELYRSMKDVQQSLLGPGVDLLSPAAHFCEYAVLGFLLANALRLHMPLTRACLAAIACASLFGVTDEIHQYFVPERMCDPLDWLVDTLGASLGALVARISLSRGER